MEVKSLVQWCVNRYLSIIERFKVELYERDMYFQPNLVKREKLSKLIFLTALLNSREDEDELCANSKEIIVLIEKTLDSLYENVNGYWDGEWTICMNLWKYKENADYEYNCFFFQLLIVEFFLRRSKNKILVEYIEDKMLRLPIDYEMGKKNCKVKAKDLLKILLDLLEDYSYIFNINQKGLRLDAVRIYSFYERYFYFAELGKSKSEWYLKSESTDRD